MSLEKILNDILKTKPVIPEAYNTFLDNIKHAEGGHIHYNVGEEDITTGYGIYKVGHESAIVFEYITMLANSLNIDTNSKHWNKEEIDRVNEILDPEVERYLTYLFYGKYLSGAYLYLFRPDMVMVMVNLYTNSPKGAWMSVQEALRDLQEDGILKLNLSELSTVDGQYGSKTNNALNMFNNIKTETEYEKTLLDLIFRKSVLLAMKSYYTDLVSAKPSKFLKFAKGWDNRIENLEHE